MIFQWLQSKIRSSVPVLTRAPLMNRAGYDLRSFPGQTPRIPSLLREAGVPCYLGDKSPASVAHWVGTVLSLAKEKPEVKAYEKDMALLLVQAQKLNWDGTPETLLQPRFQQLVKGGLRHWILFPLVREEVQRSRFRPPEKKGYADILGPRWSRGFSLYKPLVTYEHTRLAVKKVVGHLLSYCLLSHLSVLSVLKDLSTAVKMNGDSIKGWEQLVGLETMGGFLPAPQLKDFVPEIRSWLEADMPEIGESVRGWGTAFSRGVREFWRGCVLDPTHWPTPKDFIRKRTWARTGASEYGSVAVTLANGTQEKVRTTKDVSALVLTDQELWNVFTEIRPQWAKAIPKRETTKARPVVHADLGLYLKMAFISTRIEPAMRANYNTTLFMSGANLVNFWEDMRAQANDRSLWKVPLDQSNFDHHVTKKMISEVLSFIAGLFEAQSFERKIMDAIITIMIDLPGRIYAGDTVIPYNKGIMSGWRWTALLDSWINYAEIMAALTVAESRGIVSSTTKVWITVQGDDVRFATSDIRLAVEVVRILNQAGLSVNMGKTWFSRDRDEFLRQVVEADRVAGYPARCVGAILWRNPVSPYVPGPEPINALVSRWEKLFGRLGLPMLVPLLRADALAGNVFTSSGFEKWKSLPTWLGGLSNNPLHGVDYQQPMMETHVTEVEGWTPLPGLDSLLSVLERLGRGVPPSYVKTHVSKSIDVFGKPLLRNEPYKWVKKQVYKGWLPPQSTFSFCEPWPWSAVFDNTDTPGWLFQASITKLIRDRRYSDIDSLLVPETRSYSPLIRQKHGIVTWVKWLFGELRLHLPSLPFVAPAFVSTKIAVVEQTLLGLALAGAQPFRSPQLFGMSRVLSLEIWGLRGLFKGNLSQ